MKKDYSTENDIISYRCITRKRVGYKWDTYTVVDKRTKGWKKREGTVKKCPTLQ